MKAKAPSPEPEFDLKDWSKLSIESARLILSEGTIRLSETTHTAELLKKRGETNIQFCLPLLTALIAFIATYFIPDQSKEKDLYFGIAVFLSVPLLAIIVISADLFSVYLVKPLGAEPRNMIDDTKISKGHHDELSLLFSRFCAVQRSIDTNKKSNTSRANNLRWIRYIIMGSLMVGIAILIGTAICLWNTTS